MLNYKKESLRNSGLVISGLISIIFILIPYLIDKKINYLIMTIALLIILVSIANPYRLYKPLKYWINIGNFLSKINTTIILGIFFYLILVPAAIVRYIIKYIKSIGKKKRISYYNKKSKESYYFEEQY